MPGASKAGRFSFRPTRRDEGPGRGVRVVQAESRHDSLERCRDSTPVHAAEFVASALAISHLPDHPLPSSDIDLLRTSAIDMVASLGTLTFDGSNADFLFRADLGVSDPQNCGAVSRCSVRPDRMLTVARLPRFYNKFRLRATDEPPTRSALDSRQLCGQARPAA